jgi:hypothetical protein
MAVSKKLQGAVVGKHGIITERSRHEEAVGDELLGLDARWDNRIDSLLDQLEASSAEVILHPRLGCGGGGSTPDRLPKLAQGKDWMGPEEGFGVWHRDLAFRFVSNRVILLPS